MRPPILTDFDNRRRQVRHYVLTVAAAERDSEAGRIARAREGRLLTLRAGTFLVLYNLVEASTRGAVEAIHDRVTTEHVPFERLAEPVRREVVRRFRTRVDPAKHFNMSDLPSEFVAVALDRTAELSGNVDARAIRSIAEDYGFSCRTMSARTRDGADLLTIKTNRNDLAHGRKTFEEVGRDYPAGDLLALTKRSIAYMEGILSNVGDYLDARNYLRSDSR